MPSTVTGGKDSAERLLQRKALIVRIVQPIPGLQGYEEKASAYWQAARQHVNRQEASLGHVVRVFAEGVMGHGEDGMVALRQANPGMHRYVKSFTDAGATLAPFEDAELLQETVDWTQCLSIQPHSEKVRNLLFEQYSAAIQARSTHLEAALDASMGAGEVALIMMSSDNIPLPSDIERYLISPPELDQLDRWLREQLARAQQELMQAAQAEADAARGGTNTGAGKNQATSGGLWTPP